MEELILTEVNLNSTGLSDDEIRARNMDDFLKNDLPKLKEQMNSMELPPDFGEMSYLEQQELLNSIKKFSSIDDEAKDDELLATPTNQSDVNSQTGNVGKLRITLEKT